MNKNIRYTRYLKWTLFFLFIDLASLCAQVSEIEDKVVIIEKEAKLELPVASRNFEKIVLEVQNVPGKPQEYSYSDVNFNLSRLPARIKIPTIPPDPLSKLYGNYVKAGFGNYTTPYLEAFINSKRNEQLNYGFHLFHFSSKNGSVKSDKFKGLSGTSSTQADAYLHYFLDKTILKSSVIFNQNRYNYYGFNKEVLQQSANLKTIKDSINQRYNIFLLTAGVENKNKDQKISYNTSVYYYNTNDRFISHENEVVLEGNTKYSLDSMHGIEVSGLLSYSKRKNASSINRSFIQFKPAYYLSKDNWEARLGVNVAFTNDTIKSSDKLHLYPSVYGAYKLNAKLLTIYAGVDGEMMKNTYRSFVQENPYLRTNFQLAHTNKAFNFYVGGKGNILDKVNYNILFSYTNYKNFYFYNNSSTDTSKFNIYYVSGNTHVLNFKTDFSYEVIEKVRLGLQSSFTFYGIAQDTISAWHRPSAFVNLYGTYNLYEKIHFKGDFYYIGGLKARNFISGGKEDTKLPSVVDLNLKVDYNVSPVFAVFVELNNLFSKKYQLYQYYQVKGLNIIAGISYSF